MKKCKKCDIEKEESEFYKDKYKPDGLCSICSKCQYPQKIQKEILSNGQKRCSKCNEIKNENDFDKKRNICKTCRSQYNKEYCKNNKVEIATHKREYSQNNKEIIVIRKKRYAQNNKEKLAKCCRERTRYRRNNDIQFKLAQNLRGRTYHAIQDNQKSGSAVLDLGCSIWELKIWLENQFQSGMFWNNWGIGNGKWQIDHIIPISRFDLTDRSQFLKACHYTNLQPLWAKDNLSKGNRV